MQNKNEKPTTVLIKGMIVTLALTVILCSLLAALVIGGVIPQGAAAIGAAAASGLSALAGCCLTAKNLKEKKLLLVMLQGTAYLALLLLVHFAFFGGALEGAWQILIPTLAAALASCLLTGGKGKRKYKLKR